MIELSLKMIIYNNLDDNDLPIQMTIDSNVIPILIEFAKNNLHEELQVTFNVFINLDIIGRSI